LLGEFKTLSFVGDGPLPLSGADRDSIAGDRVRARRAARADSTNAKGIPSAFRPQSVFTDVEKFVSALEGKNHDSNDFLALFPTGLGKV